MDTIANLLNQVSLARKQLLFTASGLSPEQAQFKPSQERWSVTDNIEHLVWAEQGGIHGMWKTLEGIKMNKPVWNGEHVHRGLRIEDIVEKTWKTKEIAPEIARPRWGGSLQFWVFSLNQCQPLLEALGDALRGFDPETIIHPHPISGPLDVLQRLQFLRFHMDRHRNQIESIISHADFPKS